MSDSNFSDAPRDRPPPEAPRGALAGETPGGSPGAVPGEPIPEEHARSTCPGLDVLTAFSVGGLAAERLETVASHVSACGTCAAVLEGCDDAADPLAAEVRHAGSDEPFSTGDEERIVRTVTQLGKPSEPPAAAMPQTLRDYELLEELGQGGMGTVWRARHTALDRPVALKLLPESHSGDAANVGRFLGEMRAVGRLEHPNIVLAHDAGHADGQYFLAMQLVDGADVSSLSRRHGPLPVAAAAEIVLQAAEGLAYAHQHHIVHRDVKPANLMVDRSGTVKLLDLGLAKLADGADAEATASGYFVGSLDYLAPEQASGQAGEAADVYGLGCTFYKLLTGSVPFADVHHATAAGKLLAHAQEVPAAVAACRPEIPATLDALVAAMLAKQPADRPTLAEIKTAVATYAGGTEVLVELLAGNGTAAGHDLPTAGASAAATTPTARLGGLRGLPPSWAASLAAALVLVAVAWWFFGPTGRRQADAERAAAEGKSTKLDSPDADGSPGEATAASVQMLDLLVDIDVKSGTLSGQWSRVPAGETQPAALVGEGTEEALAAIELPLPDWDEYLLRLDVVPQAGAKMQPFFLGLRVGDRLVVAALDDRIGSGLELIDGKEFQDNPTMHGYPLLRPQESNEVDCLVMRDRVVVAINRKPALIFEGAAERLSLPKRWQLREPMLPFVGVGEYRYQITHLSVETVPEPATDLESDTGEK